MHESELVNCEKTPVGERGLEHAARERERERTHTLTHTLIWISFETVLWILRGTRGVNRGQTERGRERERCHARNRRETVERLRKSVEVASVKQIAFE